MKRNALIRIVLWSLVICILTSLMVNLMDHSFNRKNFSEETVSVTTPPEESIAPYAANATVTANAVNVRQAPNSGSSVMGVVKKGMAVSVTRTESVEGIQWSYVTAPCTGWVQTEYLDMVPDTVPAETTVSPGANGYGCPAADIGELDIEWFAGDIRIHPGNTDRITVHEDGSFDDKYSMVIRRDSDSLKIRFFQEERNVIGLHNIPEKNLTITVPADWYCRSLEIETASATVDIRDMSIGEVNFSGASGKCTFENCTVEAMDMGTASGDVRFVGSLNMLDCDAASAKIYAVLNNIPSRLDLETMSGDLELILPADAGFTLNLDSLSGNFSTDFQTQMVNKNHVAGDGVCRIQISALSGDVTIRKAN